MGVPINHGHCTAWTHTDCTPERRFQSRLTPQLAHATDATESVTSFSIAAICVLAGSAHAQNGSLLPDL